MVKKVCTTPNRITESDLFDYVEGVASKTIMDHVASCAYCRAEVTALGQLDVALAGSQVRSDCPPTLDLMDWQNGFLPAKQSKTIKAHVQHCSDCEAELVALALPAFSPAPTPKTQPTWLTNLLQTGKKLLEAVLMPQPTMPAFAFRGNKQVMQKYNAGKFKITLNMRPPILNKNSGELQGQISNGITHWQGDIILYQQETKIAHQSLDEFGFFSFTNLPPATYQLGIELPNAIIPVTEIQFQ